MASDSFSLLHGGLVYRLLRRMVRRQPRLLDRRAIAVLLVAIALLPLLLLSAAHGQLLPGRVAVPLGTDYALLSRLLVALPLLVLAAPWADRLLRDAIEQLASGGLVRPARQRRLAALLARVRRLRDGWGGDLACALAALLPPLLGMTPTLSAAAGWYGDAAAPSAAGHWHALVALPLFRFVLLLWLWRLLIWSWLLAMLARLPLAISPAHPDGAGGLAFLGRAHTRFAVLLLVGGVVLCGWCLDGMLHDGQTLPGIKHLLLGYVGGSTLFLLLPLLPMAPAMQRAKRHALRRLGTLAQHATRAFDHAWGGASRHRGAALLDSASPSALADYAAVFATAAQMRIIPVGRWLLARMLLAAALPLLPLVFVALPVDEVLQRLTAILA